jgi:hypothetical protein
MTPELRQRHRFIWRLWAVLLPIGFVSAILVLPQKATQTSRLDSTEAALPKVMQTRQTDWLTANIRSSDKDALQLEIILKQPLDIPAARLFWQNTFVGNLGAKGTYRFPMDSLQTTNPPFTLEIRDPINQTIFQKITFD